MNKRQRLQALRSEASQISARLADGTATDEDVARANELAGEIRTLVDEIEAEERGNGGDDDDQDQARAAAAEAARRALADLPNDPAPASGRQERRERGDRNPGTQTRENAVQRREAVAVAARTLTESQGFREFQARGFSGQVAVDVPNLRGSQMATRATIGDADIPTRNPYVPGIVEVPLRPLSILDQIDRQTTGLNSVPYVQESTGNEAGAAEVAHGALKPEVDINLTEADAPVRTIAAWLNIIRQTAEDNATMVGFIEGRLGYKVEYRLNGQVLNGDGVGPNLLGILNTGGINTYAPVAAEKRLISIRKAITAVTVDEYVPDTVVMTPQDWETVELDTDDNNQFRVTMNVQNLATPRIWGLAVVVTTTIAVGTACVGAFRLGATLWERDGVRLLMTDSHASNFTSNILTLLAEMRAALTVWRPSAFCKITFNGAA